MGEGGADGKDREPLQRSKVQMENEVSPNLWIKKGNLIRRAGYQQFYHNFDDIGEVGTMTYLIMYVSGLG